MKKIIYVAFAIITFIACNKDNLPKANFSMFEVDAVKATAGDGEALIEWTPSKNGNPQEYYLSWSASKVGVEGGSTTIPISAKEIKIEKLVNNVAYTFSVQARYSDGLSRKVSSACTPKSTRYDVEELTAAAGVKKVRLTWKKPLSDKLTGYQIITTPGNNSIKISDVNTERYVVDGLSNGTEYTFNVIAVYSNGESNGVITTATPGVVSPITTSSTEFVQNQSISFEYNDMYFLTVKVNSVNWNFGDGEISIENKASHSYSQPGTYTVSVTVLYANGESENGSIEISVIGYKWSLTDLINGTYSGAVKASNPIFSIDGTTAYIPTSNKQGDLFAIDVTTGVIKWVYPIAEVTYGGGAMVGKDGSIYQGALEGKFYAINPNGTEKWRLTLDGNIEGFPAITSDDILYIGTNSNPVTLYAINAGNGKEIWKKNIDGSVASAIAVDKQGNIYVGTNKAIFSFNAEGNERWKTSSVVNVTERGSFALNESTLYATLKNPGGVAAIDLSTGSIKWTYKNTSTNHDAYFPIIGKDGTIYYSNRSGTAANSSVIALNSDGTEKWVTRAGAALIYSGIVLSESGKIYVGTQSKAGADYLLLEIDANTGAKTSEAYSQQIMSAFSIAPDKRLYFGSVAGKLNTKNINASLEPSSWSVRGGNMQGTNSLK